MIIKNMTHFHLSRIKGAMTRVSGEYKWKITMLEALHC